MECLKVFLYAFFGIYKNVVKNRHKINYKVGTNSQHSSVGLVLIFPPPLFFILCVYMLYIFDYMDVYILRKLNHKLSIAAKGESIREASV
jgi:hypothetical protein